MQYCSSENERLQVDKNFEYVNTLQKQICFVRRDGWTQAHHQVAVLHHHSMLRYDTYQEAGAPWIQEISVTLFSSTVVLAMRSWSTALSRLHCTHMHFLKQTSTAVLLIRARLCFLLHMSGSMSCATPPWKMKNAWQVKGKKELWREMKMKPSETL